MIIQHRKDDVMQEKKLLRSSTDKVIAGVCSGLGHYMGIDPTVIRVIWALTCVLAGTGLLAYIICALLIPSDETYTPYQ